MAISLPAGEFKALKEYFWAQSGEYLGPGRAARFSEACRKVFHPDFVTNPRREETGYYSEALPKATREALKEIVESLLKERTNNAN